MEVGCWINSALGLVPTREHLVQRPDMICARIWGMRLSACKTGMNLYEAKIKNKAAIKKLNHTLAQNGFAVIPVRVIPGSHLQGRLGTEQVHRLSVGPAVSYRVGAGGVLLMRPLLLHASSAAHSPRHRLVIHLEFTSGALPGGLEWLSEIC